MAVKDDDEDVKKLGDSPAEDKANDGGADQCGSKSGSESLFEEMATVMSEHSANTKLSQDQSLKPSCCSFTNRTGGHEQLRTRNVPVVFLAPVGKMDKKRYL